MLEKINNISAGSDFTKAVRSSNIGSVLSSAYTRKVDAHDSVDISPAFKFLNSVNWKLKEFKHIVNEKLYLAFILSGVEFRTVIDLVNFEKLSLLNYTVLKETKKGKSAFRMTTDLSVRIERPDYEAGPVLINFSALNVFFQRAFGLNMFREITREEKYLFDDLLQGISFGIKEEFLRLNNHILIFMDKLTGLKVSRQEVPTKDYGETVVIKKFKVLHVE